MRRNKKTPRARTRPRSVRRDRIDFISYARIITSSCIISNSCLQLFNTPFWTIRSYFNYKHRSHLLLSFRYIFLKDVLTQKPIPNYIRTVKSNSLIYNESNFIIFIYKYN